MKLIDFQLPAYSGSNILLRRLVLGLFVVHIGVVLIHLMMLGGGVYIFFFQHEDADNNLIFMMIIFLSSLGLLALGHLERYYKIQLQLRAVLVLVWAAFCFLWVERPEAVSWVAVSVMSLSILLSGIFFPAFLRTSSILQRKLQTRPGK